MTYGIVIGVLIIALIATLIGVIAQSNEGSVPADATDDGLASAALPDGPVFEPQETVAAVEPESQAGAVVGGTGLLGDRLDSLPDHDEAVGAAPEVLIAEPQAWESTAEPMPLDIAGDENAVSDSATDFSPESVEYQEAKLVVPESADVVSGVESNVPEAWVDEPAGVSFQQAGEDAGIGIDRGPDVETPAPDVSDELVEGEEPDTLAPVAPESDELVDRDTPIALSVVAPESDELVEGEEPDTLPPVAPESDELIDGDEPIDLPVVAPDYADPIDGDEPIDRVLAAVDFETFENDSVRPTDYLHSDSVAEPMADGDAPSDEHGPAEDANFVLIPADPGSLESVFEVEPAADAERDLAGETDVHPAEEWIAAPETEFSRFVQDLPSEDLAEPDFSPEPEPIGHIDGGAADWEITPDPMHETDESARGDRDDAESDIDE